MQVLYFTKCASVLTKNTGKYDDGGKDLWKRFVSPPPLIYDYYNDCSNSGPYIRWLIRNPCAHVIDRL